MPEAVGIHAHDQRKLGRKQNDPTQPRLKLSQFLKTGALPSIPPAEDYTAINNWDIFANDTYGDCGPCSVAHSRMQVTQYLTGKLVKPTLGDVLDLYKRSGNPNFPQDDNGVILQDMLNEVRRNGIAGVKCVAFAQVDHTNEAEMDAAQALFGGLHQGVTLQTAQQTQTDALLWDYAPSGIWGGHAIYAGGYTQPRRRVVTWGEEVEYTDAFAAHQLDEAWVVIWPEHLQSKEFLAGIDLAALANAFHTLTGGTLPLPPAPTPIPTPTPTPPPMPTPPGPTPLHPAPSLDEVSTALVDALASLTGEPAQHIRDRHKHGKTFEKFYEAGGFEIGIMDKR
jgi:hypothetical protein